MKKNALFLLIFLALFVPGPARAAEDQTKKSTIQKVGGLLFDVDEGVEIEKGPGGSVYVKSNREYMQQKFEQIDQNFKLLDERIHVLESKVGELSAKAKGDAAGSNSGDGESAAPQESPGARTANPLGRRVLSS